MGTVLVAIPRPFTEGHEDCHLVDEAQLSRFLCSSPAPRDEVVAAEFDVYVGTVAAEVGEELRGQRPAGTVSVVRDHEECIIERPRPVDLHLAAEEMAQPRAQPLALHQRRSPGGPV